MIRYVSKDMVVRWDGVRVEAIAMCVLLEHDMVNVAMLGVTVNPFIEGQTAILFVQDSTQRLIVTCSVTKVATDVTEADVELKVIQLVNAT